MVRIGRGLYGYSPSQESKKSLKKAIRLQPILQWKSIISELKIVEKGEGVGYDMTERVKRKSTLAVVPIGYWHGFDRCLSSRGSVLIRGKRAKIIGRVSMSMITVDVTGICGVRIGDIVTIIGISGSAEQWGEKIAALIGTTTYEVLTRINPLIHKIYTKR
jgi:alanine racemase